MFPRKHHVTETNPQILRAAYDAVVLEGLPPITIGFSLLYTVFAIGHQVLLPRALARPLTLTAVIVIVLLLALTYFVKSKRLSLTWVHPTATAVLLVVMFSILQHIHLSGEPRQTTNLMLLIAGAGFFLLASNWFLFFLFAALGSWTLVAHFSVISNEWMHYRFGMLTAIVLSSVVHIARRRTLHRVEVLRAREQGQRREVEQARDAALEATRLKSEFLTNISHEIRTPMHGILGMTNLLRDTTLDRKQRNFADAIRSCGDHLLSLINDLLDLSKIEAGKLHLESSDFDFRKVIHESAAMLRPRAEAKGLEFRLEVAYGVPTAVRGDARRIRQVLVNLLGNAIKFTEHGAIELRIEQIPTGEGTTSETRMTESSTSENSTSKSSMSGSPASETHARVRCTIRDTGIGIPLEFRDKLFDPFSQADGSTTRRYGGTGLGLAISKQIVEAMHGEIGVESVGEDDESVNGNPNALATRAAHGSIFWFTLPLELRRSGVGIARDDSVVETAIAPESDVSGELKRWDEPNDSDVWSDETGDAARAPEITSSSSQRRILVVDDNRINQQIVTHYVERLGFAVAVASNGVEALRMFASESFALILMDCQMPEMDGLSVTQEIRRLEQSTINLSGESPRIPVIAMTAHAMPHERERCLAAGMDDYLGKPVDAAQLEAAILRHLAMTTQTRSTENDHAHHHGDQDFHQHQESYAREPDSTLPRPHNFSDELIELFIEDTRLRLSAARARLEAGDAATARNELHSLIGSCGIYGASGMARISHTLIADIATGSFAHAFAALAELEAEFSRLQSTLHNTAPANARVKTRERCGER